MSWTNQLVPGLYLLTPGPRLTGLEVGSEGGPSSSFVKGATFARDGSAMLAGSSRFNRTAMAAGVKHEDRSSHHEPTLAQNSAKPNYLPAVCCFLLGPTPLLQRGGGCIQAIPGHRSISTVGGRRRLFPFLMSSVTQQRDILHCLEGPLPAGVLSPLPCLPEYFTHHHYQNHHTNQPRQASFVTASQRWDDTIPPPYREHSRGQGSRGGEEESRGCSHHDPC